MQIVFLRHASAEPPSQEGQGQKLTPKGAREAKTVAFALKAMGFEPQKVYTSPLLHSAETAAIIAHEFNNIKVEELPSLLPPGDDRRLRQQIAELMDDETEMVLMVGHSPSLEEMVADIIADTRRVGISFSRGGGAMVELPVEDAPNGAVLHWVLEYEQLEAVATRGVAAPR